MYKRPMTESTSDFYATKSRFSVDCSKAHKGLFSGILVIILTIMSLILYSELENHEAYIYIGVLLVSYIFNHKFMFK